jgi:gamma-glutamylaminecyclotransferase
MATRLFVYGTLMRGEHHHGTLAGARFVGTASTLPRFALSLVDYYPAMSRGGECVVSGELYEVAPGMLAALDLLEDVPALYLRERIALADGSDAEAYVLPAERLPPGAVPIPGGDFRALPSLLRAPR